MSSWLTSRGLSRRDVLKGLAAVSVGTATGAAAHGYYYNAIASTSRARSCTSPACPSHLMDCGSVS